MRAARMLPDSQKWAGPELGLWAISLLVFPFYVFARGGIQPSNMVMAVMFAFIAVHAYKLGGFRLPVGGRALLAPLAGFVTYAFLVNYTWYLVLSWPSQPLAAFFYVFDFMVVASGLFLYAQYGLRFITVTRVALLAAVTLQFVLSFLVPSATVYRQGLFFGGYGQLGYFALVCASIFSLPVQGANWKIPTAFFTVGVLMCLWLAMLSLSKAAMVSIIFFLFINSTRSVPQVLIALGLLALALLTDAGVLTTRVAFAVHRMSTLGTGPGGNDDNLEGRGYNRIWENPEMLVLGAGEGANYRWGNLSDKLELHSTIGTIIFSYGIPGIVLMIAFFVAAIRPAWRTLILFMIPEIMYSLTHMSLRFVMTWVFFATLFCAGLEIRKQRSRQRDDPSNRFVSSTLGYGLPRQSPHLLLPAFPPDRHE